MTSSFRSLHLATLGCLALLALCLVPAHAEAQTLYQDDFSDGQSADWTAFLSGWSESGGVFQSSNTSANVPVEVLYDLGFQWGDSITEVDVSTPSGRRTSDLQLLVRNIGIDSLSPNRGFGSCSLLRNNLNQTFLVAGAHVGSSSNQQLLPFSWSPGVFYRLRATAIGNSLTCDVVGFPSATLTVSDPGLPPMGTIGLRATHIPGDFDNVLVAAANSTPVATCTDITVAASVLECLGAASIDSGSTDPDGDPITLEQQPPSPYPLGATQVALVVTDSHGAVASCTATVTVVDEAAPVVDCNSPAAISEDDLPLTLTATATDSCGPTTVEIIDFFCSSDDDDCELRVDGASMTLIEAEESENDGPSVQWKVSASDASGNVIVQSCSVTITEEDRNDGDEEDEDDDNEGDGEDGDDDDD